MNALRTAVLAAAALAAADGASAEEAVVRGYAPVNGLEMYYEIRGEGKPLVLIHGGGSTIETSFGEELAALAKRRRVIAYERQGHGRTADVDRPFTFAQSAEDLVALLRYLKIEKADFLGYSNGGHVAVQLALAHPELVRRLVIESAMLKRSGNSPEFWKGFDGAKLEVMPAELRAAYLKTAPRPQDLPVFFRKSVEQMRSFKDWTDEQIRSIRAPALVLCGDRDVLTVEHAVATYRLLPAARLAVLPDTDHMRIVKRGDWVVPIVEEFLDAPEPAGRAISR